jgi:prepilin-type N-terminal cleavage/methylation domain-containing protein
MAADTLKIKVSRRCDVLTFALAATVIPRQFNLNSMQKPMNSVDFPVEFRGKCRGFTLVEMLVVIGIMSILMTVGAIGLGNMGGKGVSSGVASAESLFDEARSIAVGQRTKARVLIAKALTNSPADNLRRMLVVSEAIDPATGLPIANSWVLSSRGTLLPDQTFFSQTYSKQDLAGAGGPIDFFDLATTKSAYVGSYFYYEFNAEGICTTPGASFVLGAGTRSTSAPTSQPKVTSAGKRDFGGFVVWRNGRTSVFRSPDQISSDIKSLNSGAPF